MSVSSDAFTNLLCFTDKINYLVICYFFNYLERLTGMMKNKKKVLIALR